MQSMEPDLGTGGDVQTPHGILQNLRLPSLSDSMLTQICNDMNFLDLCWMLTTSDLVKARIATMELKPKMQFFHFPHRENEMSSLNCRLKALEGAKTQWKISLGLIIPFCCLQCRETSSASGQKVLELNFDFLRTLSYLGSNLVNLVLELPTCAAKSMEKNGLIFRLDLAFIMDMFPNLKRFTFDNHSARDNWMKKWEAIPVSERQSLKPEFKSAYFVDFRPDELKTQQFYKIHCLKLFEIKPGDRFSEFLELCPKLKSCTALYYFDKRVDGAKMCANCFMRSLGKVENLKKLEIEAKKSSSNGTNILEDMDSFKNLKKLHVQMCYPHDASDLYRMAISLSHVSPTLESLKITIGQAEWLRAVKNRNQLESLQIGFDEIIRRVSSRVQNLKSFQITSFKEGTCIDRVKMKCAVLAELIHSCPSLGKLWLDIELDDEDEFKRICALNSSIEMVTFNNLKVKNDFFEVADNLGDTGSDFGEN